jgi:hypothetical protein
MTHTHTQHSHDTHTHTHSTHMTHIHTHSTHMTHTHTHSTHMTHIHTHTALTVSSTKLRAVSSATSQDSRSEGSKQSHEWSDPLPAP